MNTINRFLFAVVLFVCSPVLSASLSAAPAADSLWNAANTLYVNGDYKGAAALYEDIVEQGLVSPELFYNMGNAYFKDDRLGESIVAYRKAQLLNPSDADVAYNLGVANSYVKDRLNVLPEFFLTRWVRAVAGVFSGRVWAVLSLLFLLLTAAGVLLFLLARAVSRRKLGMSVAIVSAVLFVASLCFMGSAVSKINSGSEAVIISESASVKSSPDRASIDLFILHEGTVVEVATDFGEWNEIVLSDGSKGWIRSEQIKRVAF
ncbi:MAG: tetratricopeptide repeat protein [Tidjanibacter sp.]|nr:tetratricopeptide repeat protein [Tidjanibacter sp.]